MEHWDDQQWLQNFHMRKDTFMELCEWLTSALTQWDTHMQPAIPLQKQITIAIWKLTMPDSYRSIGNQFSVGRLTVGVVVMQVVRAINTILLCRVIILGEVDPIVAGFAPIDFPSCWGGTLTAPISPSGLPTTGHRTTSTSSTFPWSCRPSWTSGAGSLTLTSGGQGNVRDTRLFRNSSLFRKMHAGTFFPDCTIQLGTWTCQCASWGTEPTPCSPG